MPSRSQFLIAAFAGLLCCTISQAQVRTTTATIRQPIPSPSQLIVRSGASGATGSAGSAAQTPKQAHSVGSLRNGRVPARLGTGAHSFDFDGTSGVPGLGFDFPHLAAISGGAGNSFGHSGHNGRRGQEAIVPIFFGGYPYYYDDSGTDQQEQPAVQQTAPQPQIIVIQQPVAAQAATDAGNNATDLPVATQAAAAEAPVRDVGDFILVRRDGRILFASLFSVVGTQLQYVSPDGLRHTLAVSEIDTGATQQMNEARGTSVLIQN